MRVSSDFASYVKHLLMTEGRHEKSECRPFFEVADACRAGPRSGLEAAPPSTIGRPSEATSCFEPRDPVDDLVGAIFGGVAVDAPRGMALSLIGRPSDPTMRLLLRELAGLALSMVGGTAVAADEPRGMPPPMIGSPSDPVLLLELLRRIDIAGCNSGALGSS